jgi:hypothetical protein
LRAGLLVSGVLALLAAVVLGLLYRAVRHVPEFYRRALEAGAGQERLHSDQMLQRTTALANDVKRVGRWQALFTQQQINGWLAVDLKENHGGALPTALSEPRIEFLPGQVNLACRYRQDGLETVLSLRFDVSLSEPDGVALRLRKARAGALPLPVDKVLKQLGEAARRLELKIQWRQAGGDPVAILPLDFSGPAGRRSRIETLSVRDGEFYAAGQTRRDK